MSKGSILIVDDNPMNRKLLKVLLETEGHQVVTAVDAEDTLRVLHNFHPQLILMDFDLPGMDGLELTKKLKENPLTSGIFIVMVTSYVMKGQKEKAKAAGCDAYVSKPIDTLTFTQFVKDCLRGDFGRN